MKTSNQKIDILCVGEALIDFIGHQIDVRIDSTRDYHRYLGGSPTNVAMNIARLGLNSAMIATVGDDGFGAYILERLSKGGVNTSYIKQIKEKPTSVIFISRTQSTPDFIPFREADSYISEDQIPIHILKNTKIFHTTCFALSKEPAQSAILKMAKKAFDLGCKLSIDINYAQEIWEDNQEALQVIKAYCKFNPYVKISEDDMMRLFGQNLDHSQMFDFFHKNGVDTVCLTLGSKGVILSQKNEGLIQLPAIKVEVISDATGAGDAFWSGFIYAKINDKTTTESLNIALQLASLKLQNVGRLPENINIISKLL